MIGISNTFGPPEWEEPDIREESDETLQDWLSRLEDPEVICCLPRRRHLEETRLRIIGALNKRGRS